MSTLLLAACDASQNFVEPEWTLSRMLDQPRYNAYAPSEFFDDGRAMRKPVAGTVPRGAVHGSALVMDGFENGTYATHVPMPLTRALLERGHAAFDVVCATCHGGLGDGNSPVAAKMQIRKPPSLLTPDIASFAPGRVYRIVTVGYGLMPAIDYQLNVEERWAIVAYLQALQRSQVANVNELPPGMHDELTRAAP